MIKELKEDNELLKILSSFSCEKDEDIQHFLREKAVDFEKLSKARTYLVCDQDQLENEEGSSLIIYGYISLALKVLSVPEEVSNRVRKELDGFNAKIHGERISDFSCYLIGQLSRNSNVPKDSLNGEQLLKWAFEVIASSVDAVGGRYVMIECHDNQKLIQFYRDNDFQEIARIPDHERPMVQMIRKI